ncbi:MAG: hypothetical protein LQ351_003817 [Letrouitia transgressa]|nr:MAG: hypothetical protein LQ351_003817 [Letrouitia transgressa]
MELIRRIDYFGATLLLAASVLFITALEEGGTEYSWHSALVLVLLVLSFFVWIAFLVREKLQGQKKVQHDYLTVVIDIPQKFQVVYGDSSARAGYRMVPVLFCLPLAGLLSGVLTEKKKVPPMYTLLVASLLQILGLALMTTISVTERGFPTAHYGYEVLMGLGFGLSLSTLIMSVPLVSEQRDRAITMGAIAQFRTLGGSVGVSICTNVLNNRIKSQLTTVLSSTQISGLLHSSESLKKIPQSLQWIVQSVYAGGFNEQMKALTAFGAAAMLTAILMWEKKPRRIP